MDCMKGMPFIPELNREVLAIVDPPYGIYENTNRDLQPKGALWKRKKYNDSLWNQEKPGRNYFNKLLEISKNQIVWGGNYFTSFLKESRCWLIWDKREDCPSNDFADCELAWTSFSTSVKKFSYLWNGMFQKNMKQKEIRIHPTQKPMALYRWLLRHYAEPGQLILDTHMGSGSLICACIEEGYDYIAFEIDKNYYEDACKRIENFKKIHKRELFKKFGGKIIK